MWKPRPDCCPPLPKTKVALRPPGPLLEAMASTSQKVVLHPFVHVSITAELLLTHVRGSATVSPKTLATSISSDTGKSGAPGTMSSQPDPPPPERLEHQNPPAGVNRAHVSPPTPAAPMLDTTTTPTLDKVVQTTPHGDAAATELVEGSENVVQTEFERIITWTVP